MVINEKCCRGNRRIYLEKSLAVHLHGCQILTLAKEFLCIFNISINIKDNRSFFKFTKDHKKCLNSIHSDHKSLGSPDSI